jgi:hypothetical protein
VKIEHYRTFYNIFIKKTILGKYGKILVKRGCRGFLAIDLVQRPLFIKDIKEPYATI